MPSFLNDFNWCSLFKIFVGSPSKLPLFSCPPALFFLELESLSSINFLPGTSSVFPQLFQPVNSHLVRHSSSLFFQCTQFKFFGLIIFFSLAQMFSPCSFASRHLIVTECGRPFRRFVCVPINSRLSPHSNILNCSGASSISSTSFPTVFSSSGP